MSPRLSKIVTHTGDDGTTGLGDGTRLFKDSARIEAIGAVDELNSALGVLLAQPLPDVASAATRDWLVEIQQRLFDLGGELAVPGLVLIGDAQVQTLEQQITQLNALLPPLKEFVLPGGGGAAAACHLARTICRRAERRCWALTRPSIPQAAVTQAALPKSRPTRTARRTAAGAATAAATATTAVPGASLRYLNRLSDLLFVLARSYARAAGSAEPLWRHRRGSAREA